MGGYSPESSAKVSGGGVGSVGRNKGAPKGDIEGQIPKALKPQAKPKPKQTAFPGFLGVHRLPFFVFGFPAGTKRVLLAFDDLFFSVSMPNGFPKRVFWFSGCSQRAFVFRIF